MSYDQFTHRQCYWAYPLIFYVASAYLKGGVLRSELEGCQPKSIPPTHTYKPPPPLQPSRDLWTLNLPSSPNQKQQPLIRQRCRGTAQHSTAQNTMRELLTSFMRAMHNAKHNCINEG